MSIFGFLGRGEGGGRRITVSYPPDLAIIVEFVQGSHQKLIQRITDECWNGGNRWKKAVTLGCLMAMGHDKRGAEWAENYGGSRWCSFRQLLLLLFISSDEVVA
ncbi:unnamed protein product [Lactuca virosa]|uniref:Uncharacterized protein n=1 Tax=Lactuca virosa TaxID=75947 RepID=A0AAU9PC10_9ASTR|nr:unnamed protein product [Lactuca virosa]